MQICASINMQEYAWICKMQLYVCICTECVIYTNMQILQRDKYAKICKQKICTNIQQICTKYAEICSTPWLCLLFENMQNNAKNILMQVYASQHDICVQNMHPLVCSWQPSRALPVQSLGWVSYANVCCTASLTLMPGSDDTDASDSGVLWLIQVLASETALQADPSWMPVTLTGIRFVLIQARLGAPLPWNSRRSLLVVRVQGQACPLSRLGTQACRPKYLLMITKGCLLCRFEWLLLNHGLLGLALWQDPATTKMLQLASKSALRGRWRLHSSCYQTELCGPQQLVWTMLFKSSFKQ